MMRLALRFLIVLFLTAAGVNAQQLVIGVGTTANDGSGDPVRTAFQKANTNFTAVFLNILTVSNTVTATVANLTTVSNSVGTVAGNLTIVSNSLTTVSNSLTGKINAQTGTTYSFLTADAGKLTTFNSGSATAVSLGVFNASTVFHVKSLGQGLVTITPSGGTIDGVATLVLNRGKVASLFTDGTNWGSTLDTPNVSGEQTPNVVSVVNPAALSTAQRIDIWSTVDSVTAPANFARMQLFPNQIDLDEVGTGSLLARFTISHNNTARHVWDLVNGHIVAGSGGIYGWDDGTPALFGQDTGIKRKSAGVVTATTVSVNDTGQFSSINGLSIGSIFTQTADAALGNTVTETSILGTGSGTKTVAAGALNTVGRTLRVRIKGMISNAAGAPTLTIRFKVATVTVLSGVFTVANATNDSFDFNVEMTTRTTGTSGTFSSNGRFNHNMTTGSVGGVSLVFSGTQTNNLTLSNAIDVTAQWSAANSSNTVGSQIATIEILN